jgi:hypothetical protein
VATSRAPGGSTITISWVVRFRSYLRELDLREKSCQLELRVAPLYGGPHDGSWRYFRAELPPKIYFVNARERGCYLLDRARRRYVYQGLSLQP